jgi:inhibitor of KinA
MPGPESGDGIRFQRASDQSLLVYLGSKIAIETHQSVMKLLWLLQSEPVAGVRNLHPAYCSLLVEFDAFKLRPEKLEETLRLYLERIEGVCLPEPRMLEIPVCYGGEFGPDLEDVCARNGLTAATAIELHASATYVVFFLGFVPGFAYLGGLPRALAAARLATPRRMVPAGSVGIAGDQTGVYPFAMPGGWRLIGRTPAAMFQPSRKEMSLLSAGDRVRFVPISREEFATRGKM